MKLGLIVLKKELLFNEIVRFFCPRERKIFAKMNKLCYRFYINSISTLKLTNQIEDYSILYKKYMNIPCLDIEIEKNGKNDESLKQYISDHTNTKNLKIKSFKFFSFKFITKLVNLKELYLRNIEEKILTFKGIYLNNCVNLEKLSVIYYKITDLDFLNHTKKLRHIDFSKSSILNLDKIENINFSSIRTFKIEKDIEQMMPLLKKMDGIKSLKCCLNKDNYKEDSFVDIKDMMKNLNTLKIYSLKSFGLFDFISSLNIKELDLNCCLIEEKFLSTLSKFKNLSKLKLGFTHIKNLSFLENLTNLLELNLDYSTDIEDFNYIGKLTNLKCLSLMNCELNNIQFINKLRKLESLNISNNRYLDNFNPIHELKTLKSLNVERNDIKNYLFLNGLTNLKDLKIKTNLEENNNLKKQLEKLIISNKELANLYELELIM